MERGAAGGYMGEHGARVYVYGRGERSLAVQPELGKKRALRVCVCGVEEGVNDKAAHTSTSDLSLFKEPP